MATKMPPFSTVLKSREVEDPVNVWMHRPLAYAFAWLVFPTPMTPNMVTFLAILAGVASGTCFLVGTKTTLIAGGILLWSSAILDGADGILARAKNMQSEFGRAIDGAADSIVAICTVLPALWHIWTKTHSWFYAAFFLPAIISANVHLTGYDYYKESYLRMTRLDRGGEGSDPTKVRERVDEARSKGWAAYFSTKYVLVGYMETQQKIIRLINPRSLREGVDIARSQATADAYRRENRGPMRLWAIISLAPHSYLMAICAMADRIDVYLWIRVILMNVLFVVVVLWQRAATARTIDELVRLGAIDASAVGTIRGDSATLA